MTLKEIKLAREVWPPNIEKILEHYENAKKIMPSNYEIYKDKARLFYVLREYRKFHEEIKQWKKIADGKWSKYIEEEIDFLTTTNRSKITPWEHFERYFESFLKGYKLNNSLYSEVMGRLESVEKRGRYKRKLGA